MTRRDEKAKNLTFNQEGRGDDGTQSSARQAPRKWEIQLAKIGLINQLSPNTAGQTILIDRNVRFLGQRQLHRQGFAADADASDFEFLGD